MTGLREALHVFAIAFEVALEFGACNESYRSQCYLSDRVFRCDEIKYYLVDGSTVRCRK